MLDNNIHLDIQIDIKPLEGMEIDVSTNGYTAQLNGHKILVDNETMCALCGRCGTTHVVGPHPDAGRHTTFHLYLLSKFTQPCKSDSHIEEEVARIMTSKRRGMSHTELATEIESRILERIDVPF